MIKQLPAEKKSVLPIGTYDPCPTHHYETQADKDRLAGKGKRCHTSRLLIENQKL